MLEVPRRDISLSEEQDAETPARHWCDAGAGQHDGVDRQGLVHHEGEDVKSKNAYIVAVVVCSSFTRRAADRPC